MNNKNTFKKIKWYQRLLYIVPVLIVFVSSCCFLIPKNNTISASADYKGSVPTSGNMDVYMDMFQPDYVHLYPDMYVNGTLQQYLFNTFDYYTNPSLDATQWFMQIKSPQLSTQAGTSYVTPSSSNRIATKATLGANSTAVRAINLNYDFDNLGSFDLSFAYTKSLKNEYFPFYLRNTQSTYQLYYLDFYYDNLVIPRAFLNDSNLMPFRPYVSLYYRSGGDFTSKKTGIQVTSLSYTGKLYNEYGFLQTYDNSTYYPSGTGCYLFDPIFFSEYVGDLLWFTDLTIRVQFGFPAQTTYFSFDYTSMLARKSENLTFNALNYLREARFVSNATDAKPEYSYNYTGWMSNMLTGIMDSEILPGFSLGGLLGVIIISVLAIWILKLFAGG